MANFDIKAASSSEVSDERALAKVSKNFRKIPIFLYGTVRGRAQIALVLNTFIHLLSTQAV